MKRRGVLFLFLLLATDCTVGLAQSSGEKLAYQIPHLYGPNGLVLPNPFHSAHFQSDFQASFTPLNTTVATQLSLLPLASPASGFVYRFDPSLGVYSRSAESFGPILTERAETIGRHRAYLAGSYQYFSFSTLDGAKLNDLPVVFRHQQISGSNFEKDYIRTNNSIDLKINQFTISGTVGLTDRIDVSVAIPIVNVHMGVTSDASIVRVAQPDPVIGQAHYFNPSDPQNSTRRIFSNGGNASGIGDVTFRAKGTIWQGESAALAFATDIRTPSGDAYNFLGTGSWGIKPFFAASLRKNRVAPHANIGYEFNGNSVLAGDITTGKKSHMPGIFLYAAGVDVGASRRVTVDFDLLGQRVFNTQRAARTTYTDALGQSVPDIAVQKDSLNIVDGSVGTKINLAGRLLLSANLIFKLNDAGLRARVVPLVGLSYTF
jgi:hypothetical protein